jgi:hypothetical protein
MGMGYDERTGPLLARVRELEEALEYVRDEASSLDDAKRQAASVLLLPENEED